MPSHTSLFGTDPESAIVDFEQILLSNSGEDAFESAIKLLAAKLVGEMEAREGQETEFRIHGSSKVTHEHVEKLYKKAVRMWPALDGNGASLGITPDHLMRAIRPMTGWSMIGSDLSHLDAALERLVSKDSKGSLGQYFTPREVIRFCVRALHPAPRESIIDPACGSAGFLFEASRQSMFEFGKSPVCLGIDFGARAAKVATLLAAASRQYSISVSKANSLDGRDYVEAYPKEWSGFLAKEDLAGAEPILTTWGAWSRLQCDVLFANPPFAGDIDDAAILAAYASQQGRRSQKSVSREHLFLERSVRLLRPGGRMAIVLPQGLLANSSASYLRQWLFSKVRVLGVVGLHSFTFLPHTNVKTSVLFAERKRGSDAKADDYNIFFATSKSPGKDSSGRQTGNHDYDLIASSFMEFLSGEKFSWSKDVTNKRGQSCEFEVVRLREVLKADRIDAEYYDPTARRLLKQMNREASGTICDYTDGRGIEKFRARDFQEISYIDISSVDNRTGLVSPTRMSSDEAPSRASYVVSPGDVLISTVRPDRGVVALITDLGQAPLVASNGFCVLRPRRDKVEPEVLFAFCKSTRFRTLLARAATASMYPTVTDTDVLDIPMPLPPQKQRARICADIQQAIAGLQASYSALASAITSVAD